jgi:hypothetical protein
MRIPVPKPAHEPNRCNLKAFKPEMPRIAPYLVLARRRLALQVVCLGLAHFRLPVRPLKSPSRATRENPGRPVRGRSGRRTFAKATAGRRIVPDGKAA